MKFKYKQIKEFLSQTSFKNAPVIPLSARSGANIDILIEAIETNIPTPKRNPKAKPIMLIARSFDINKPGTLPQGLTGGVLGGALKQGLFRIGDEIEIKPGRVVEEKNKTVWYPITTRISGLKTGGQDVKEVGPGGSIGVMTLLDPAVVKSDSLAGSLAGKVGELPSALDQIKLEVHLLDRVVGLKEELEVKPLTQGELLMINVNSTSTVGVVSDLEKKSIRCNLKKPICAESGSRVTISRRLGNRFRLIGYGILK